MSSNRKPNRLINEKSPYLQQHAYNPVDWYPWCEEAFEKAKKEDKPIFLSIGYSTCHWCHVMEKESFEDEEVAKMMNETFVNIKVDREERPDIDQFYMKVCTMMTGRGGWPLTVIMTPDKKPFFVGTYFPKESRYGVIGMKDLIPQIKKLWEEDRENLLNRADKILKYVKEEIETKLKKSNLTESILKGVFAFFSSNFDEKYGGFNNPPKFPSPHNLLFLLRYYKLYKEDRALYMVEKTLKEMAKGGIYDHVGYGFHRYSTDERWLLPHFEKMLYDQAMLLMAYTEAYQITKNEEYKKIANQIVEYVFRDMLSEEGAFYSAEDADSEGEEGKFYTWEYDELKDILGENFEIFAKISNIKPEGNYLEEATRELSYRNIIHISKDWEKLSQELGISEESLKQIYEDSLKKLFEVRKNRIRPLKDTKILTDWNGLFIKALTQAGLVFNNDEYIQKAKTAMDFILNTMLKGGILYHRYKDGEVSFEGNLDDYAFTIYALLELYQVDFYENYLQKAIQLTEKAVELFYDKSSGGFFFTSEDNKDVPVRQKEVYDGAYPSGNSIMYNNLVFLYKLTSDEKYKTLVEETEKEFYSEINLAPYGHTMFLIGFMSMLFSKEIIFVGQKEIAIKYRKKLEEIYQPFKVIGYKDKYLSQVSEFIKSLPQEENIKVYICENFACNEPVSDINQVIQLIS